MMASGRMLPTMVARSSTQMPSRYSSHLVSSSRNQRPNIITSVSCSTSSSSFEHLDRSRRQYRRRSQPGHKIDHRQQFSRRGSTSNAAPVASSTIQSDDDDSQLSPRQKNWRIAKELGKHVWPPLDGEIDASEREHRVAMRQRVVASVTLMLAGKGVTIATPFMFKSLVDTLPMFSNAAADVAITTDAAASNVPIFLTESLVDSLTTSTMAGVPALPFVLLLSYGTARTLSSLFQESRNAVFANVAQSAIRSVGRSTFDHVHSLDMQFHLNRNTGTLSRILERGSRSISFVLNAMVFNTVPTFVEVGVVTGCMWYQFGIGHASTVLATIGAYVGFTVAVTHWRTQFRKDMNRLNNQASGKISDSLLNYETVKYFNNEGHEGRTYEATLSKYQSAALRSQTSLSALNFGQSAIFTVGLTTIMYLTAKDFMAGNATMGDIVLVNGLLFQLSVPLNFIGSVYREIQQCFIDMEAMFGLRDTRPALEDKHGAVEYDPVADGCAIEFDELEFAYSITPEDSSKKLMCVDEKKQWSMPTTKRPILRGTTFAIPQGKTVAIVGTSGCGKSTLLRMLFRFYAPDAGAIRIGGRDVSDYTLESVRRAIAVVPQDIVLFNDSIGYNIHYGNLDASWEDVIEAAKRSRLHDIIEKLPSGYDTVVGERGLKLSGGEKQRVSLARAILKKSPILLCDEPTSSLDSHTELEIMNNLKEIGKDTTCVIIAHRLSTVQDCDEIIVMDEGRVIEQGNHEELMRMRGRYSELVAFQRSHGVSEES